MKILIAIIVVLIVHLQYRLWLGDASIAQVQQHQQRLNDLNALALEKKERNDTLYAEIVDIKFGHQATEERARYDLGMIKENETFFQVIE